MTTFQILEQDRIDAENFLEQLLTDAIPTADFRKGGALRDFAVGAMGSIFAFIRREVDYVKARQSLLLLGSLTGTDVDTAVDEIMSNWFLSRKGGQYSRGQATLFFTQALDVTIPHTARFLTAEGLAFNVDSTVDLAFLASQMLPVYTTSGYAAYYTVQIPLVSDGIGASYDIAAGSFPTFSRFSPYLAKVENPQAFTGGGDIETTEQFLNRAETAISTRNMISARSIDATVKEAFTEVDDVKVIGYGDPEMTRDFVEEATTRTRIHVGGAADAFIRAPIIESKTVQLEIGGVYTDSRPGVYILRDDALIASGTDFVTLGVLKGDILQMHNNLVTEASQYIVDAVTPLGVYVSRRSQFPNESPVALESFTDGILNTGGAADELTVGAGYTLSVADIGRYVRTKNTVTAGNTGIFQIQGIDIGTKRASLVDDAGAAVFVDESGVEWDLIDHETIWSDTVQVELVAGAPKKFHVRHASLTANDVGRIFKIEGATATAFNDVWQVTSLFAAGDVIVTSLTGAAVPGAAIAAESNISAQLFEGVTPDNTARDLRTVVSYTIGNNDPSYNNKVDADGAGTPRVNGRFTREIQEYATVMLPQEPIYNIRDVTFIAAGGTFLPYVDVNSVVRFGSRVNTTPAAITSGVDPAGSAALLTYQVECPNPSESQSGWQLMKLRLPTDNTTGATYFDGQTLTVTYDTISNYSSVWGFMLGSDRRIVCGSVIPRGFHPVYISAAINYRLARAASEPLDHAAASLALVEHINAFSMAEELDTSDIMAFLRETYSQIGYIEPVTLTYELIAPDGRIISYETSDVVSIDPAKHLYPLDSTKCLFDPLAVGVTTNTIRHLSTTDRIAFNALS